MIDADAVDPIPEDEALFDADPIPLTARVPIPPFPVGALPGPVADMVTAVSEFAQTDPAMPAASALSALSACTGGHAEVEIRGGWREPCNLYIASIAAPGERKSAVQQLMIRPVVEVERELSDKGRDARSEAETRKQVATKTAEQERNSAAKASGAEYDKALRGAVRAAQIADAIVVPAIPRLIADDVTPEAAGSLLAEQGGRLAIISAEGGIFDIVAGRYSNQVPNMDLWLKGHSGDMLRVDRKSRDPEYVPKPAVTLGLMIQHAVLHAIAANPMFRGRGFLARVLYALPESKVGHRRIAPDPIDDTIVEQYGSAVGGLAAGMHGWGGDPAVLMLTPSAHEAVLHLEEAVEPTLADDGELAALKDWGSKYVGAIVRIAGILHLADLGPEDGPPAPVSVVKILEAARIGAYFKACAVNSFIEMGADTPTADAVYLIDRVNGLGVDEVSERDLFTASSRARFKTMNDLLPALERLVDHGYLAAMPPPKPTGGRPASPRYRVHPLAAKAAKHAEG